MAAGISGQVAAPTRQPAVSAGIPILTARITVPGVPEWAVPRPRITELIAEGTRGCPLTMVTGPPGAGKTVALALWAAAEPGTVAWISLDEFENQPRAFWSYAVAALDRSGVALPDVLPAASRRRAADYTFLVRLASALAAQNPPVTLVIDDLHVLTKPTVLTELDYVLRNARPGLRVVVSSRTDPLLPLHRYRLAGELGEIRASDLAFSTAEARLLLAQHGSALSADSFEAPHAADRGLGGRPPPGRDLHGWSSRPRPVRQGADHRGQRPDCLPGGRGPQGRVARGPGNTAEHVRTGAGQRRSGRRTDRQRASRRDSAGGGARERVCRSRPGVGGIATTRCSRRCCG